VSNKEFKAFLERFRLKMVKTIKMAGFTTNTAVFLLRLLLDLLTYVHFRIMFMPYRNDFLRLLLCSVETASRISLWTENAKFSGQI
jgi:hypothetical protein